jgi:hypothetical protein
VPDHPPETGGINATSSEFENRASAGVYSKFLASRTLERCPANSGNLLSNSVHSSTAVTDDENAISTESHFVASLSWEKNKIRTASSCLDSSHLVKHGDHNVKVPDTKHRIARCVVRRAVRETYGIAAPLYVQLISGSLASPAEVTPFEQI